MPEKPDRLLPPELPGVPGVTPVEEVLGGAGPRGEVAGCPTGLADEESVEVNREPGNDQPRPRP
jgi:hypothetical protein